LGVFAARLKPGVEPKAADDIASVVMVPLSGVDFEKMSSTAGKMGVRKLQEKYI
jgi:hypothetical protein